MPTPDHVRVHRHSIYHREEVLTSECCGCFYCYSIFSPAAIKEWTDEGQTVLCPKCGIDSVVGSKSGYLITKKFLGKMKTYWF